MAKRANTEVRKRGMAELGSLERFTVVKVQRKELNRAPYNPKTLSDKARKKLDGIIRSIGLVEPACVWNVRSGNICGGHQRLRILDAYYGGLDYELTVSRIDVGPKREREVCVALSNVEAMGDLDPEKLGELFSLTLEDEGKLDLTAMGYDAADVFRMGGADAFSEARGEELLELGNKLEEQREHHAGIVKDNEHRDDQEFYVVFVWKHDDDVTRFLNKFGFEQDTCQNGQDLERLLETGIKGFSVDVDEEPEEAPPTA